MAKAKNTGAGLLNSYSFTTEFILNFQQPVQRGRHDQFHDSQFQ